MSLGYHSPTIYGTARECARNVTRTRKQTPMLPYFLWDSSVSLGLRVDSVRREGATLEREEKSSDKEEDSSWRVSHGDRGVASPRPDHHAECGVSSPLIARVPIIPSRRVRVARELLVDVRAGRYGPQMSKPRSFGDGNG